MPHSRFQNLTPERQDALLDAAMQEFANSGYQAASTNRIVTEAGIAKGSLFYYFAGKDDLYQTVIRRAHATYMAEYRRHLPAALSSDLIERLRVLTVAALSALVAHPTEYRVLMTITEGGPTGPAESVYREQLADPDAEIAAMMDGVDETQFRLPPATTYRLVRWIYAGIKLDLTASPELRGDPGAFRNRMLSDLETAFVGLRQLLVTPHHEAD